MCTVSLLGQARLGNWNNSRWEWSGVSGGVPPVLAQQLLLLLNLLLTKVSSLSRVILLRAIFFSTSSHMDQSNKNSSSRLNETEKSNVKSKSTNHIPEETLNLENQKMNLRLSQELPFIDNLEDIINKTSVQSQKVQIWTGGQWRLFEGYDKAEVITEIPWHYVHSAYAWWGEKVKTITLLLLFYYLYYSDSDSCPPPPPPPPPPLPPKNNLWPSELKVNGGKCTDLHQGGLHTQYCCPVRNFFYSHYHSCHLPETSRWSDLSLSVELILELFFLYTLAGHRKKEQGFGERGGSCFSHHIFLGSLSLLNWRLEYCNFVHTKKSSVKKSTVLEKLNDFDLDAILRRIEENPGSLHSISIFTQRNIQLVFQAFLKLNTKFNGTLTETSLLLSTQITPPLPPSLPFPHLSQQAGGDYSPQGPAQSKVTLLF